MFHFYTPKTWGLESGILVENGLISYKMLQQRAKHLSCEIN